MGSGKLGQRTEIVVKPIYSQTLHGKWGDNQGDILSKGKNVEEVKLDLRQGAESTQDSHPPEINFYNHE